MISLNVTRTSSQKGLPLKEEVAFNPATNCSQTLVFCFKGEILQTLNSAGTKAVPRLRDLFFFLHGVLRKQSQALSSQPLLSMGARLRQRALNNFLIFTVPFRHAFFPSWSFIAVKGDQTHQARAEMSL